MIVERFIKVRGRLHFFGYETNTIGKIFNRCTLTIFLPPHITYKEITLKQLLLRFWCLLLLKILILNVFIVLTAVLYYCTLNI